MNRKTLLMTAIAALTMTACSTDEEGVQAEPGGNGRALTIYVTENAMVNPDALTSRAAISTTKSIDKFYLNYAYGTGSTSSSDITATREAGNGWTVNGTWPDTDKEVTWYAQTTNGTTRMDEGNPYIDFTVGENSDTQHDLLVATTADTYDHSQGAISFNFDHACTALRFYVKKNTNLSDYTLSVSNIRLCHINKSGEYHYNTGSWTAVNTLADFTLYSGTPKTLGTTDYEALNETEAPYLFLIPQTLTAWSTTNTEGASVQLQCTITKNETDVYNGTAIIPFAYTLQKGYQHDVKINIGKNSLLNNEGTRIVND